MGQYFTNYFQVIRDLILLAKSEAVVSQLFSGYLWPHYTDQKPESVIFPVIRDIIILVKLISIIRWFEWFFTGVRMG
jgi:hypothetical protein